MGELIDIDGWDREALTASWQQAEPFRHLVIDDLVRADWQRQLLESAAEEPCELIRDQIFEVHASASGRFEQPALAALHRELDSAELTLALGEITGLELGSADMRAFAYHPGQYLLPHTDLHGELDRRLAYAYYLERPEPVTGGELDLFHCELDDHGAIVRTELAISYAPTPNRIVLFEVGPHTLHQVREVTAGIRLSLAGWFYP